MLLRKTLALVLLSFISTAALADAQVVNGLDATEPTTGADVDDTPALPAPVPGASGSLSQQVNDLRQQVATQTQMLQQVQTMQQQTQQLQGQLDDQQHAITQLQQQQLQQYQDLDSRLTALTQQVNGLKSSTGLVTPGPVGASSATTAASVSPITPQPQAALAPAPSVNSAAVVIPAKPPKAAAVKSTPQSQSQLYQAAYNQMLGKHYDQAISGMQDYLAQYPSGSYAPNAYYWLGELYLLQGNIAQAIQSFSTVVNQFPQSTKVPDAMLKLGFAYYDQGNNAQAMDELKKVQQQFPNSSAAHLAAQRLQSMTP